MTKRSGRLWPFIMLAVFLALTGTACSTKPEAGEIGVQRGGGPIEGKTFKKVVCPGVGTSMIWNDSVHYYPHSGVQRYFTIGQGEGDLKVPVKVQSDLRRMTPEQRRQWAAARGRWRM